MKKLIVALLVLALLIPSKSEAQGALWVGGVDVYLNPSGYSGDISKLEEWVKYGVWSWSDRTGIKSSYKGITPVSGDVPVGSVVVVFKDMMWFYEEQGSFFVLGTATKWTNLVSAQNVGATIRINSTLFGTHKCGQMTIVHELGHVYGKMTHSANMFDVMYPSGAPDCRYALSHNDIASVGMADNSGWAELTRENDVYIPSFNGMSGLLEYQGDYKWELTQYSTSSGSKDSVVRSGEGALLPIVKGPHSEWRVVLGNTGGDEWVLINAE